MHLRDRGRLICRHLPLDMSDRAERRRNCSLTKYERIVPCLIPEHRALLRERACRYANSAISIQILLEARLQRFQRSAEPDTMPPVPLETTLPLTSVFQTVYCSEPGKCKATSYPLDIFSAR